jgi:hypothetical protein
MPYYRESSASLKGTRFLTQDSLPRKLKTDLYWRYLDVFRTNKVLFSVQGVLSELLFAVLR